MLNVMAMHVQMPANVSKQKTLLNGFNVGPPNWRLCRLGFNHTVHEGMDDIPNVKVHLKIFSRP